MAKQRVTLGQREDGLSNAYQILVRVMNERTPISRRELWGLADAPLTRLARLLAYQRLADEAEAGGRFRAADFLWAECGRLLEALQPSDACWGAAAELVHAQAPGVGQGQLRTSVRLDGLVDCHLSWAHGWLGVKGNAARALDHAEAAARLLPPGLESAGRRIRVRDVFVEAIRQRPSGGAHAAASCLAERGAAALGGDIELVEMAAGERVAATLDVLETTDDPAGNRRNAARIEAAVKILGAMAQRFPRSIACHDALALLLDIQGVAWMNGGRPATALVSLELALAHDPRLESAARHRREIEMLLPRLVSQLAATRASLGSTWIGDSVHTTELSPEGQALAAEVEAGTGPRDALRGRDLAAIAQARRVASSSKGGRSEEVPAQAPLPPAQPVVTRRRASLEPLALWLVSRRNRVLVLACGIALGLLVVLASHAILVRPVWLMRERAWDGVRRARGESHAVVAAAGERFRSLAPPQDPRLPFVEAVVAEALRAPDRRARDAAYGDLQAAVRQRDTVRAAAEAERFLDALHREETDLRRERVEGIRDLATVLAFIADPRPAVAGASATGAESTLDEGADP